MSYRWLLGLPLLASLVLWGIHRWDQLPATYSVNQVIERLSPWPTPQPSPTPVTLTPCTLLSAEELSAVTLSNYLPSRLSIDQDDESLITQRCLWLATDEKLTPTVTVSLRTPTAASPSAANDYWAQYLAKNQAKKRFRSLEVLGAQQAFADSWGTHVQTAQGVMTVQASMPEPKQNQSTELQLLQLILPRLLASDS